MMARLTTAGAAIAILVAGQVSSFAGDLSYKGLAAGQSRFGGRGAVQTQKSASYDNKKNSLGVITLAKAKQPPAEVIPVPEDSVIIDDHAVHLDSGILDPVIVPDVYGGHNHGECGSGNCSHTTRGRHRTKIFAEYLYLRSRDSEVAYGTEVDGAAAPVPGIEVGRIGMVDPNYEPGYRVGFAKCFDDQSSVEVKYAHFESDVSDAITRSGTNVIRAQVTHPLVTNASFGWLDGSARLDVDFDLVDADYRWIHDSGENYVINLLMGVRYGHLEQRFSAAFSGGGTRNVATRVDFEGVGVRVGADFERYARCRGWMVYGRSEASLLAGEFSADYFQGHSFDSDVVATSWDAGRIVPMLDLELGVGWENKCGSLRFTLGYMYSAWFNTVQTDEWIRGVHVSQYQNLSSATTFDGLTLRGEYRF